MATSYDISKKLKKAGFLGDMPGGTHFHCFYETQEDLLDILVIPYSRAIS